ncbi:MAG: SAM-dependent methyltransferase [Gammaproteobacteria bacterium]|nr:SAM-dependent methyltransferase [Gammaproteobacteria bacterium]
MTQVVTPPPEPSVKELIVRLSVTCSNVDAGEIISKVADPRLLLQDFRPAGLSLEWDIGALHWRRMGLRPFVRNEVPFLINNDGLLSALAAAVMFTHCRENASLAGPINIVEYGAGSGLFARYFLDALRELCRQQATDDYQRITYYVTDASPQTVRDWVERGLFADHDGRVIAAICHAEQIPSLTTVEGQTLSLPRLRAAFCNYLLDVLPCAVVRRGDGNLEELNVRTYLTADSGLLAEHTRLSGNEILALVHSDTPADRAKLEDLMVLFDYETRFLPVTRTIPYSEEAMAWGGDAQNVVLNYGAFALLEHTATLLDEAGFMLVNDYGATEKTEQAHHGVSQRFGVTSAIGINFPLLEHFALSRQLQVHVPPGDAQRSIHTRLLTRRSLPATEQLFHARFAAESINAFDAPAQQARAVISSGHYGEALDHYRAAIEQQPRNWRLLGEIAEFILFSIQDAPAALELAQRAVALNPNLSAWLWNILGDALWVMERPADAHTAYQEAQRIDPDDPRTQLNLAYTLLQQANPSAALNAIAKGLAYDKTGVYRERLLTKQQHILASLTATAGREQQQALRRLSRLQTSTTKNDS